MPTGENPKANGTESLPEWNAINWQYANRQVRNLRQRIFRAEREGNHKLVRSLQKLLLRSTANKLVSVRRVTQTNDGKDTPGVDKLTVKTPKARMELIHELGKYEPWKAKPARRVYIPKKNGKLRPLGIPTIIDRCIQAIIKNALEPQWEARFEGISYGFRLGRSAHDALMKTHQVITGNKKVWIVDADIKGAFDNINHNFLLEQIGSTPGHHYIKQCLKSGVMEDGRYSDTLAGTPQGGVISPLLANIALHGMEEALGIKYVYAGTAKQRVNRTKRAMVRYADDFVIFCESKNDAVEAKDIIQSWLKIRGLELSEEKTRIIHASEGFDFLGCTIIQRQSQIKPSGHFCHIFPSKKSVQAIRDKIREIWLGSNGGNPEAVIKKLNPIITGWANYHRKQAATDTFQRLDNWMFHRETRFLNRAFPQKNTGWKSKYFGKYNLDRNSKTVFGIPETGLHLKRFEWHTHIVHRMIAGTNSPDDPSLTQYFKDREMAKTKTLTPFRGKLAKKQNYVCPVCANSLFNDEELHEHHIVPKRAPYNGKKTVQNTQLVHLYCHHQLTAIQRKVEQNG